MTEERSADVIIQIAKPVLEQKKLYLITKRAFDIVCSFLGLLILAIPMIIIALIITLDSPGSPIFKQERLGLHGKPFMIYKFRSMRLDAEENGPQWADEQDPRCTRFGQILRRTRLDELPQFYNILRGDMSVVGNRPLPLYEAERLTSDEYIERFMCPSGLTGLWQVEKRGQAGKLSPEQRKQLDIEYARKMSPWFDLKIILRTFTAFIQKENV